MAAWLTFEKLEFSASDREDGSTRVVCRINSLRNDIQTIIGVDVVLKETKGKTLEQIQRELVQIVHEGCDPALLNP